MSDLGASCILRPDAGREDSNGEVCDPLVLGIWEDGGDGEREELEPS